MNCIYSIKFQHVSCLLFYEYYLRISVKSIIGKIAKGMNLSDEELQIANDLDIWYIYFDSNGVQTSKGNFELVNNYINDCTNSFSNGIVPLCFTINKFEDNSIGNIDIGFELP